MCYRPFHVKHTNKRSAKMSNIALFHVKQLPYEDYSTSFNIFDTKNVYSSMKNTSLRFNFSVRTIKKHFES